MLQEECGATIIMTADKDKSPVMATTETKLNPSGTASNSIGEKTDEELLELMRKGPRELLTFEEDIRHNNQVIRQQTQAIVDRLETLETGLQGMMQQLEQFIDDNIQIEPDAKQSDVSNGDESAANH